MISDSGLKDKTERLCFFSTRAYSHSFPLTCAAYFLLIHPQQEAAERKLPPPLRGIMKLKHRDNFSSFSTARVIFTRSYRDGASAEKYFYQPTSVAGTKNSDRCGTNIKNFPPKAPGRHDYTLVQKKLVCLH